MNSMRSGTIPEGYFAAILEAILKTSGNLFPVVFACTTVNREGTSNRNDLALVLQFDVKWASKIVAEVSF